jgi:hypothetical protein
VSNLGETVDPRTHTHTHKGTISHYCVGILGGIIGPNTPRGQALVSHFSQIAWRNKQQVHCSSHLLLVHFGLNIHLAGHTQ